jgi:hypothetical protein
MPDDWGRFVEAWNKLRFHWNVPIIHMRLLMRAQDQNPKNEWSATYQRITDLGIEWSDWRESMLRAFAELVFHSPLVCVGAAVDVLAYKAISRLPGCKLVGQDTNVFCLQESLWLAMEKIKIVDPHPSITLVIDDDKKSAYDFYQQFKTLRSVWDNEKLIKQPGSRFEMMKNCVNAIAFGQDTYHPALQAADMISFLSRRFKTPPVVGKDIPTEDLYAWLTMGGTHQPKFYNKETLLKLAGNTHQALEKIQENDICDGI